MGRPILFLLPGILLRGPLAALVCVCLAAPATAQTSLCCPADLDGDGMVGAADLALVVGGWGTPQGDVDGDGATGPADLALLLGAWGTCATEPCLLTRVVGRVVFDDGAPAGSAVIVTNEGGKGVSGPDGAFSFDVEVEKGTSELQVTAIASVRGVTYAGTTLASPIVLGGVTDAGEIVVVADAACEPSWLPTFGGAPGADNAVKAFAVFDDGRGGGPALYAGGLFTTVGGVTAYSVAKWDGFSWSPLGSAIFAGGVRTLTVFDDGSGAEPALYAGGEFTQVIGVPGTSRIAKWDGESWSSLATGLNDGVFALQVFDDGSGPALFAGGTFTQAGDVPANGVAKWDGASWAGLGSGTNGSVWALTVFDDPSRWDGPALYVGGSFTVVGGIAANYIARWDGEAWSALGSGMGGDVALPAVYALAVFDDGGGPALHAGGGFARAGEVAANRIAKWSNSSWSALGDGVGPGAFAQVRALQVFDDGTGGGPALYVGGDFASAGGSPWTNCIARWDGLSWSALGNGVSGNVSALAVFDDGVGGGAALFAGGNFTSASGVVAMRAAKWSGGSWSALGSGIDGGILALASMESEAGASPDLFAAGAFTSIDGVTVKRIAKWDGSSWSALGSGMSSSVNALAVFDDGSGAGPSLYAGGMFAQAGGVVVNSVARWDGSTWWPLGSGIGNPVNALTVFDDGSGPALYAGGAFLQAGGVPAKYVAKWDGTTWSALGSGLNGLVRTLAVFDDGGGGGPALYAGGWFFIAGSVDANHIARWNGSSWTALGSGMNGIVNALAVLDDGSGEGPRLVAGGEFTTAGGVSANRLAAWNGSTWSPLADGVNGHVFALSVFDYGDGRGPLLYAGGGFTTAGGATANRIAAWDGSSWSPLGDGFGGGFGSSVFALTVQDPGSGAGPALFAGGGFAASPAGDSFLAKWGCADEPPPDGAR